MPNYNYLRLFNTRSTIFNKTCLIDAEMSIIFKTFWFGIVCIWKRNLRQDSMWCCIASQVYYSYDFILCNWRVSLFSITLVWLFGLLFNRSSKKRYLYTNRLGFIYHFKKSHVTLMKTTNIVLSWHLYQIQILSFRRELFVFNLEAVGGLAVLYMAPSQCKSFHLH